MQDLNYGLKGKVAVVTGGSRGIGLDLAANLLAQGVSVAICGRKKEGLEAALNQLAGGERLMAVAAHVAKPEDVANLFDQVTRRFGRLDILVNNVGMNIGTDVVNAEPALFNKIVESNLTGTWLCSRQAARIMKIQQAGRIINVTSLAAHRSAPFMGIYGIAKAAVEMLTKTLAQELAPFNIQVNAVAPGMVRTQFSQPFWSQETLLKEIVKGIPMGRIAETIDVIHPILFLCSAGAGFITGQTLSVDGGASAV